MTTQPALLLDRTEVLPRIDVNPRPAEATVAVRHPALDVPPRRARPATALIVQPRRGRPAAALIDALRVHDLDSVVAVGDADDVPDPGASPLAILVGPDSLGEARELGRLDRDLEWIRRADEAGTAVLGIGHGARVLALALGGAVEPAERPLRGWAMVDTSVPHIIPSGPWLAWQHDVITLPPAATLLAHNLLGPQAFRVGRHLGVQFHPEATPEVVAEWAGTDAAPAGVRRLLGGVARDPGAAAVCTQRLLGSFISGI
jgi:GMP synthase-like glutamine amidotransferase